MGKEEKKDKVRKGKVKKIDGEKKSDIKITIISGIIVLGIFAFVFWVAFVVISYRRPIYLYEGVGSACSRDEYQLYYEKDGVRYFNSCYDEVNVVEKRFIFYYRYDIKKYIDAGRLLRILQKATINKWNVNGILQTNYLVETYGDGDAIEIIKCQVDGKTDYYFVNEAHSSQSFCRYFYQM